MATITGISFSLSLSLWGLGDVCLLHPEKPPCVTVSSVFSLELPLISLKFPKRTARKTVNSSECFFQLSLLSFQACSALQWHHMGIRQASLICTCVWAAEEGGGRTWDRREERERLCSEGVWPLSPSWGCCDYLVEITTLSTRTKLTMANDPWTGIDSCRKCRQCSLHPE